MAYSSRPHCPASKASLQLYGASIVRIVSPRRPRLSETISETSESSADFQQLISKIINVLCSNKEVFCASSPRLFLTRRSRPSQCGFWHWNDKERAREQLRDNHHIWFSGFHHELRRQHFHEQTVWSGLLFQLVVVSLCTKDTRIVHGGVNRGTKMIWCLEEDQSEFLEERRP